MNQAPQASLPEPLRTLQGLLSSGPPGPAALAGLVAELKAACLAEHALAMLRPLPAEPRWEPLRAALKAEVAASRIKRMALWQTDANRKTLRLRFQVTGPVSRQHPPALAAQLARTLLEAGVPVAMGLEKTPRPALHLGHPLPLDLPGRGEWADAALTSGVKEPMGQLPGRINAHAPEGLEILECGLVPNYASPVSELCRAAIWRWRCPEEGLEAARAATSAFLLAERFEMEKAGKAEGQKVVKRVEIRGLVEAMAWDGPVLDFRTRIVSGQAPNPRKLLGAILGQEPGSLTDLERLGLILAEDPRLLQADRYEPKLHNMYEDATLLDAGSHIRIIDGDDDEPILLR